MTNELKIIGLSPVNEFTIVETLTKQRKKKKSFVFQLFIPNWMTHFKIKLFSSFYFLRTQNMAFFSAQEKIFWGIKLKKK